MNACNHWCVSLGVCRLRGSRCVPAWGGVYVCVHTWAAVYTHVRTNACLFGYTGATVNTCEDVKMFGVCERVSGRGDIGLGCAGLGLVASPAG